MSWIALHQISPTAFELPLAPPVCVGPPDRLFMFGGVGLGAALRALETVTGRPAIWATAQYESYARPGETVRFDVSERVRGNAVSQARVTATAGDREILTVVAALGRRDLPARGQWTLAPRVPPPDDCPPRALWPGRHPDDIHARVDFRIARGAMHGPGAGGARVEDGNILLWARPAPGAGPIDTAFVCVVADYVPSGVGPALGRDAGGNSLDNSIRFHRMVETRWLLCDVKIHGVAHGFAHGRMHIFAETGELIATASQSLILRLWDV
ncbi:acyl-CoA thioesterase [Thermaurantiacus tibetensis]|uniref:acyl-CoA thioesterase n=1 Tax=Thermaurantiacus tibetensis TaxID=2759035 RepID=UPI00188E8448|nr:acyl-CoA thioesterase domain-containing protein [Thermaurantiacus tibetensis]